MQLRQKEREKKSAQGEEADYKPDEIKHDLKPDDGVEQKDIQPIAGGNPQVNQWYEKSDRFAFGAAGKSLPDSVREGQ